MGKKCFSILKNVFLLKVALSKVLDPDIEMKGKSGADKVMLL